jgi:hypothetical protein
MADTVDEAGLPPEANYDSSPERLILGDGGDTKRYSIGYPEYQVADTRLWPSNSLAIFGVRMRRLRVL